MPSVIHYPSISHKLMKSICIGFLVLFCLQILLLLGLNTLFGSVRTAVEKQNAYNSFETELEDVQSAAELYWENPEGDREKQLDTCVQVLKTSVSEITDYFPDAQMNDLASITTAYLEKVAVLKTCSQQGQTEEILSAYQELVSYEDLVLLQYKTTISFQRRDLSSIMEQVVYRWRLAIGFILLGMTLFFLLILMLTYENVQNIVRPLEQLCAHARKIEEGCYTASEDLKPGTSDYEETYRLTSAFIHMEATIRRQIEDLKDKITLSEKVHALEMENMSVQMTLKDTENSLMQSLINPHFLFNCLNLLASFAIMEHAPKVHDYALQISVYLRHCLNYIGRTITLKEEFEFTGQYLEIQKNRMGDRLEYELICEEECEDLKVPAIILQPLAENVLVHGIGSYLKNGRILMHAFPSDDDHICIIVEDNGVGMTGEQIAELKVRLQEPFRPGQKGTGLPSVMNRLKHHFHQEISLEINSVPGEETIMEILLPVNIG